MDANEVDKGYGEYARRKEQSLLAQGYGLVFRQVDGSISGD